MERIMIIGCCGSGKTTLGRELSEKLDLPLYHLDKLNWTGHWQMVSAEEFDNRLLEVVKRDRWIIDGNYNRTIPLRLNYCDTVIYLDYPRISCILGVLKRVITGYGKTRPDMGGDCPERFDLEFMKFVWSFNKNNRQRYLDMLKGCRNKKVIILHNRRECADFIKSI